ncbi:alpha/beta-hydrolase, partial [Panus rudis PR-1116 ss-1]
ATPSSHRQDLRHVSFQQALPHLARLSEDPEFVSAISKMKKEQADLETRMYEERNAILAAQQEKVRVAKIRCMTGGSGFTQFEADSMSDAFRKELLKFDAERVLPAWDGLLAKQQASLEALGVPGMFQSMSKVDREVSRSTTIWVGSREQAVRNRRSRHQMCSNEPGSRWSRRCYCLERRLRLSGIAWDRSLGPAWALLLGRSHVSCPLLSTVPLVLCPLLTMPYVDFKTSLDYASLWYSTNAPYCNVGSFNPDRPTIVILHPFTLDSTWCYPQIDDPRINAEFNVITFDTRITGKSACKFNTKYDLWVAAADLAHAFYHLCLPPAHIFASEVFVYVALRLSVLFPDLCLSLTLCNVPPQIEKPDVTQNMEDIVRNWCYAEDLPSLEHANKTLLEYSLGSVSSAVHLVGWWQANYPPFRRAQFITLMEVFCLSRDSMTDVELATVRKPVLILQANDNPMYPMKCAKDLQHALINVPNGAMLQTVQGAIGLITLKRASIVNKFFRKFLDLQTMKPSKLTKPTQHLKETMSAALKVLAELRQDPSIRERDKESPISFSCISDETAQRRRERILEYARDQRKAFSPLGMDGRPLRK